MKIVNLPVSERPMEKALEYGVENLSNVELLALIINSGTVKKSAIDIAAEVIGISPHGISALGELGIEDLLEIKGIGSSKAIRILAAVQLGIRMATAFPEEKFCIRSNDDVAKLLMERLRYEKKEHFLSILLNSKGEVIEIDTVSIGELSATVVHPREVFNRATKKSAASIILAHNHPSGDPTPSVQDVETTKRLVECGRLMGIKVLDHVIIGNGDFSSLKALDMI